MTRLSNLNHGLFNFDKNLSFAALFMNSDKEIYGRYGTRAGGAFKGPFRPYADTLQLANKDMTDDGFTRAVDRVLKLHKDWQADQTNKKVAALIRGKRPKTYQGRPVADRVTTGRGRTECYHCHRIAEEEVASFFNNGKPTPDEVLWSYPMPDKLGFTLDPDHCATVTEVGKGSEAEKAGLQIGDAILRFAGQSIVSIADIQWVLHRAPAAGSLPMQVERDGKTKDLTLTLTADWRRRSQFAWRYSFNALKGKLLGFDEVRDLEESERVAHGIKKDESSILVARVLRARRNSGTNPGARKSGMRSGDIILSTDGRGRETESEMLAYVLQNKKPGDTIRFTVLRDKQRKSFEFSAQRLARKRGHDH